MFTHRGLHILLLEQSRKPLRVVWAALLFSQEVATEECESKATDPYIPLVCGQIFHYFVPWFRVLATIKLQFP